MRAGIVGILGVLLAATSAWAERRSELPTGVAVIPDTGGGRGEGRQPTLARPARG